VGAFNGDKGELVGIADGEYSYRLSPEFTVRLAKATLSDLDNNVTGALVALPCVKSK
jgi:hypothetical protein